MRKRIVALAVLVAAMLSWVLWLAAFSYGASAPASAPPACVVLHVAATPWSPAYPLEVCGTHLSGRWRCQPATLMHGPALACARPTSAPVVVSVPAAAGELPPECVSVDVHAYQPAGNFTSTWLKFCGGHPGADSALRDPAQGRRFTLDGATAIGRGCGTRASPCVIFPGP